MSTSKHDVAVFIDFENIYVSVREKFDATPNFEAIMERCEDYGRVVVARAYADWYRYPRITSALFANNIEPMYVPTYYYDKDEGRTGRPIKNSVDMHMCIDAMRTLYTRTNIDKYIFITGDRDFIALVNCVRQEGKDVIIIGIGGAASSHLAQSADEFLFYEQVVDIRPMGQQTRRQERTPDRSSERPERDRSDRNGRDDRRRERSPERERPAEKPAERAPEKPVERPTPIVALPTIAVPVNGDETAYDTLVEALELARKRGYVTSFGSLKVLMKELMPNFKENRYRDPNGKTFSKFTDFVREAERRGKIQIFTSGTVNEVFLPNEDPYKLSQFAEDLPSAEAERELEQELAEEAAAAASEAPAEQQSEQSSRRRRRRGQSTPVEQSDTDDHDNGDPEVAELSDLTDDEVALEEPTRVFGDHEWSMFYRVMRTPTEPVPFAEIFNALRDLRNNEELDLTNNELKELVKQAINAGKVQRTNRGAKAHYRLIETSETAATEAAPPEFTEAADQILETLSADHEPSTDGPSDDASAESSTVDEETPAITEALGEAFDSDPAGPSDDVSAESPTVDEEAPAITEALGEAFDSGPVEPAAAEDVAAEPAAEDATGQQSEADTSTPEPEATLSAPAARPAQPARRRRKKVETETEPEAEAKPKPSTRKKAADKDAGTEAKPKPSTRKKAADKDTGTETKPKPSTRKKAADKDTEAEAKPARRRRKATATDESSNNDAA